MSTKEWKQTGPYNWELRGEGFRVSYLSDTKAVFAGVPLLSQAAEGDTDEETALVLEPSEQGYRNSYYILNGDWRDTYTNLVPLGFDACLEFYHQKRLEGAGSTWATGNPTMPTGLRNMLSGLGWSEETINKFEKELEDTPK